jgi:hypothetical protein
MLQPAAGEGKNENFMAIGNTFILSLCDGNTSDAA